ncbi:MAG: glycosyltransferase, partial [Bacilli bacterium]|nr:glycosyltransferase [Bacilli bacterium]
AFSKIRKQNDILELVGAGIEENNLKQLVNDLGIQKSVHFSGRVSRDEVLRKMKESHIFAMVSDYETYGMVYIEAMLQGCITIASKRGGFDGIIQDGENGFLCNPGDSDMLCDIFKKIVLLNEEERNRIGQNAINVGLNFSEKDVANNYLAEVIKRNDENYE